MDDSNQNHDADSPVVPPASQPTLVAAAISAESASTNEPKLPPPLPAMPGPDVDVSVNVPSASVPTPLASQIEAEQRYVDAPVPRIASASQPAETHIPMLGGVESVAPGVYKAPDNVLDEAVMRSQADEFPSMLPEGAPKPVIGQRPQRKQPQQEPLPVRKKNVETAASERRSERKQRIGTRPPDPQRTQQPQPQEAPEPIAPQYMTPMEAMAIESPPSTETKAASPTAASNALDRANARRARLGKDQLPQPFEFSVDANGWTVDLATSPRTANVAGAQIGLPDPMQPNGDLNEIKELLKTLIESVRELKDSQQNTGLA